MEQGMHIDNEILVATLQNKLAQAVIREAQLEAAIQGLLAENKQLQAQVPKDTEVAEDARSAESE